MKEKELRAGIRRVLRERVLVEQTKSEIKDKFVASNVPGSFGSYDGARSPKEAGKALNMPPAVIWTPEDPAADPIEVLKSAGLKNVVDHGFGYHTSKYPTLSFIYPDGTKGFVAWQSAVKSTDPDKQVISNDMLGIFAEHATVAGLGGSDTIDQAKTGLMSAKYAMLNPTQAMLADRIYLACQDLARQAMAKTPQGEAVNGNDISKTAQVDVIIRGEDASSVADVHVKFNDGDRLFGLQANDATGEKFKVTSRVLMDDASQPGTPAFSEMPSAAKYKVARNAFLNNAVVVKLGPGDSEVTTTPFEVITGQVCAKTECPIKLLSKMKAKDSGGKMRTLELQMLSSDVKIGDKSMRQAYIDYLDDQGIPASFLEDIKKFFKAGLPEIFFFNYKTSPPSVTTGTEEVSVSLDVNRLKGNADLFTIDPIIDGNKTNLYTVSYDGNQVFEIEARTSGQGHPPQIKVSGKAPKGTELKETSTYTTDSINVKEVAGRLKESVTAHPGLLESLSGLMVEAYAPGTKIGLIPMAAKPYHAGHHSLVQTAAAENDQVLLYISLSDRKRKGELTIQGADMERIWKEEIEKILPGNVTPVYGGIPVRKVYEILGDAEEKLQMDVEPPVYTVYSDPTDTARNYSAAYRMKYFPTVASEGYVKFAGEETPEAFTRGEGTPDVSGTAMRASLQCGDEAAFAEGLPDGVDKEKIFNMLCPIQRMKSTVEEANFRMSIKRAHHQAIIKEQSLYDTFVKPFSDVAAVTTLVAQDVLAASLLNLKLWWNLGDPAKQKEAFQRYDKVKESIKGKMKPYMDAVDERLANADVSIIAAAVAPGWFFGQMGLEGAYEAAKGTKDFLAGAGLDVPFLSAFFDGEDPPDKGVARAPKAGLLGGLKTLFFGESAQFADLPIIAEQPENKGAAPEKEKKKDKPPLEDALEEWLKDSGVRDRFDEYARSLYEAAEKYVEDVLAMAIPTIEVTMALRGIDTKSDQLNMKTVNEIMAKAKEYNLPGADQFEQKLQTGAKKISDKPEFEEKADELADAAEEKKPNPEKDGASDKEEQDSAEKIAIVEFLDSFKKDSEEGVPQLIDSAMELINKEAPKGMNLEALNTSEFGKKYVKLFTDAESKLKDAASKAGASGDLPAN
jgi:hypothetical protein